MTIPPLPPPFIDSHPPFPINDYTGDLLAKLQQANVSTLPPGYSGDEPSLRLTNMIWRADLELQAQIAYYEKYVPVVTVIVGPRRSSTPDLPPSMQVELTPDELAKVDALKAQFQVSQEVNKLWDAFQASAKSVYWDLSQLLLGRLDAWAHIAAYNPDLPGELGGLPKSLAMNFASALLVVADMSLEQFKFESAWPKFFVSCTAFVLDATALELSGGLAIGAIGITATAMDTIGCAQAISNVAPTVINFLKDESRLKLLIRAGNLNQGAAYYIRTQTGADIFDKSGKQINSMAFPVPLPDNFKGTTNSGKDEFDGRFYEDEGGFRFDFSPDSSPDPGPPTTTITVGFDPSTGDETGDDEGEGDGDGDGEA